MEEGDEGVSRHRIVGQLLVDRGDLGSQTAMRLGIGRKQDAAASADTR